ncbi:Mitochondrial Carrier (MC) Family, partial [Phytophthora palmivora]
MASADGKTKDKHGTSTTEAAVAGAVSGVICSSFERIKSLTAGVTRLVAAPLDLIKIRFQVQPAPVAGHIEAKYAGLLQAVRSIYAEEGLRSFWRGNLAASGLWIGYSALQFASYR